MIQAGILQPIDYVGQVQRGFQMGQQQRREIDTDRALQALMANPDDPQAIAAMGRANPRLGFQLMGDYRDRQAKAAQADVQRRAVQGDPAAMAKLAGIDLDAWSKIDDRGKAAIKGRVDFMGQAALAISQLPEAQRPAAWDAYIDQGVQMGYTDLAQHKGRYSPDGLNGVLAQAGQIGKFLETQKVDWKVIPEGGKIAPFSPQGQPLDPSGLGAPAPAGVTFTPLNGGPTPQASGGFPGN